MPAAYIEHRPLATDAQDETTNFVIIAGGKEVHGNFKTQTAAKEKACSEGYKPIHVARVRHLQDRDKPDHWRHDPCPTK
jgi:hypothetical protein